MFERFTDRARRVVVLAQEEATLLDHNSIGTEHLLLGLLRVRTIDARADGEEPDRPTPVTVAYCGRCGAALQVVPPV
jgi:Clp amino terminal domain, pathogenicity island component